MEVTSQVASGSMRPAKASRHELKRRDFLEAQKTRSALKTYSSSRLFVKNIPKHATEKRVREFFARGKHAVNVTDVQVLKNTQGVPRQVAFVGFKTTEEASKAKEYFDRAYFDTSKIRVSFALPYGDRRLDTLLGKRSRTSPNNDSQTISTASKQNDDSEDKKKSAKLSEFLSLMQPRSQAQFWANDDSKVDSETKASDDEADHNNVEDDSDSEDVKKAEVKPLPQSRKRGRKKEPCTEIAAETGRLFIRNLSYSTTEADIKKLFEKYGTVTEAHIPVDSSKRSKGFAFVQFMLPAHALKAMAALDKQIFQGRLIHIMSSMEKDENNISTNTSDATTSSYKAKMAAERREKANDSRNWNALFVRGETAVGALANRMGIDKGELLLGEKGEDEDNDDEKRDGVGSAVRMAIVETQVINETKKFLDDEGVDMKRFEEGILHPLSIPRSKSCLLVKNLPFDTDKVQLRQLFSSFGDIDLFLVPPSKTMGLVSFYDAKHAKKAFGGLAYKKYKDAPLYLEWAPEGILKNQKVVTDTDSPEDHPTEEQPVEQPISDDKSLSHCTLYVKNLSFNTTEEGLKKYFEEQAGKVLHVSIPKKNELSMGFGFVEFSDKKTFTKALRSAHAKKLDGHELLVMRSELKIREPDALSSEKERRERKFQQIRDKGEQAVIESSKAMKEKSTKLIVRNLAFEANRKELKQLMKTYGQVNTIRIPKKYDGSHRGFAFVDFVTHQEAKAAFKALNNTHLYGRHLVIAWAANEVTT